MTASSVTAPAPQCHYTVEIAAVADEVQMLVNGQAVKAVPIDADGSVDGDAVAAALGEVSAMIVDRAARVGSPLLVQVRDGLAGDSVHLYEASSDGMVPMSALVDAATVADLVEEDPGPVEESVPLEVPAVEVAAGGGVPTAAGEDDPGPTAEVEVADWEPVEELAQAPAAPAAPAEEPAASPSVTSEGPAPETPAATASAGIEAPVRREPVRKAAGKPGVKAKTAKAKSRNRSATSTSGSFKGLSTGKKIGIGAGGAVALFVGYVAVTGGGTYVASCVDTRTSLRVENPQPCEQGEVSYYKWWYTKGADSAPEVGAPFSSTNGTFTTPEESISYPKK